MLSKNNTWPGCEQGVILDTLFETFLVHPKIWNMQWMCEVRPIHTKACPNEFGAQCQSSSKDMVNWSRANKGPVQHKPIEMLPYKISVSLDNYLASTKATPNPHVFAFLLAPLSNTPRPTKSTQVFQVARWEKNQKIKIHLAARRTDHKLVLDEGTPPIAKLLAPTYGPQGHLKELCPFALSLKYLHVPADEATSL